MFQLHLPFRHLRRGLLLLAVLLVAGCGSPAERAQNYYERAMKLLSHNDFAKAGIEFKNALQLKKDLVGAWRGLLEVEAHNRNYEALIPILRTIVELDPKDVDAKLKLGRFLMVGNALDQALDLANAAIEIDGRNPSALAVRAAVLLRLNDGIGAKREAQAALDIDPKNAEGLIVLAAERMVRGDIEGALLVLERDPSAHEKDVAIQLFKLHLFERAGDLKQAESLLRKLTELYPQERAFRLQLIRLYIDQKRPDDAEKELRALAAANPSDFDAGLNVVRFLQGVKGAAAARDELVARINAGQQAFRYQIALAEFDFAQGNLADSIRLLETLASGARSRDDALAAQVKLAQIQLSRKNFGAAEALVADILRKDSHNIDGLKLRASIRMEHGQLESAIADLRQALNDRPRSGELMQLLAAAYERSGSIELAEKQFADATKASDFDAATGLSYAAFLRRRGNLERAEDVLTEASRRQPSNVAALTALADVRLARQNWAGAQAIAETIQRGGGGTVADQILAAALTGQSKYDEGIKVLESVYSTAGPGAVQPMAVLVNTLVRAQKLDRAVSFLQTVLQANPDNAEAHAILGSVQILQKIGRAHV